MITDKHNFENIILDAEVVAVDGAAWLRPFEESSVRVHIDIARHLTTFITNSKTLVVVLLCENQFS